MSSLLDTAPGRRVTIGAVAALEAGEPGATPVLLVPGYTGSKESFGPILGPLADASLRPVAIDLPGQYESPGVTDYGVDALGAVVRTVAGRLGGRAHLVGHSFGGLVARAAVIADRRPFASLVLMSSGPAGIEGDRRERIERLRPVLVEHGIVAAYDAMHELEVTDPGWVQRPPELEAFLRRRFVTGDPLGLLGMGDALIGEPDRVDALAAIDLPTLVLTGAADDAWPPDVQARMAKRLGADYVEVPGAAHSPAVENPAATAGALIRFWRS